MTFPAREILRSLAKQLLTKGVRKSYAQNGEDAYVMSLFGANKGLYVEVGAFHPIQYSNTYALYRKGWRGVVIEPNERAKPLFRFFRRRDVFVNAAVGNDPKMVTYYYFSDPAYNTCDDEEAKAAMKKKWLRLVSKKDIYTKPLTDILASNGIQNIDFMSVDTEGYDYNVLMSHDWSMPPEVIAVECHGATMQNMKDQRLYAFLASKGYELKGMLSFSLIFKLKR